MGLTFYIHAACLIKVSPARAQPLEAPVPIRYVSLCSRPTFNRCMIYSLERFGMELMVRFLRAVLLCL